MYINKDLAALFNISKKYCLSLNPNKSKVMVFGRKIRMQYINQVNINIDNETLPIVESSKNLGLYIDTDMKFNTHINHI